MLGQSVEQVVWQSVSHLVESLKNEKLKKRVSLIARISLVR
jgi:hypothetical protein